MMDLADFKRLVSALLDELPEEFFRDLSGGVLVSAAAARPDYARDDDIYTLGEYRVFSGVRQIILYKGSFDRTHPHAPPDEVQRILRGVIRHEFRHHLEHLGGIHGESSLEAQDRRDKLAYLARKRPAGEGAPAGPPRP